MAAKQIIVLTEQTSETEVSYNVLFWFPITLNPVARTAGSTWTASGTSAGASAAENAAVQNGSIIEEQHSYSFPVGTLVSAIQAVLQAAWARRNAQIAGQGANQFYGAFFDGSAWGQQ